MISQKALKQSHSKLRYPQFTQYRDTHISVLVHPSDLQSNGRVIDQWSPVSIFGFTGYVLLSLGCAPDDHPL